MWLEGVRFPDMVRWGDTDGVVDNGKRIPSTYDAFFSKKSPNIASTLNIQVPTMVQRDS